MTYSRLKGPDTLQSGRFLRPMGGREASTITAPIMRMVGMHEESQIVETGAMQASEAQ